MAEKVAKKKKSAAVSSGSATSDVPQPPTQANDMIEEEKKPEPPTPKESINEDEVLFKLWHIVNAFDDQLFSKLSSSGIKTMTDLKTKDMSLLVDTIEFDSMNEYTTREMFVKQVSAYNDTVGAEDESSTSEDSSEDSSEEESSVRRKMKKGGMMAKKEKCAKGKKKKRKAKADNNIGFAVGGAMDINTFRMSIDRRQMPQASSITYEGLFNDYYFDTGSADEAEDDDGEDDEDDGDSKVEEEQKPLFYPSYNFAKSRAPKALVGSPKKTKKTSKSAADDDAKAAETNGDDKAFENFLTIGLNSNIKESDFQRKKLNLVIVLDISGSMGGGFGGGGRKRGRGKGKRIGGRGRRGRANAAGSKMRVANECVLSILTHLRHDDNFGLVLFDTRAETRVEFKEMKQHKLDDLEQILRITPRGGTNFECGYKAAVQMFEQQCKEYDINQFENRIIYLTDARPNAGNTDPDSLMGMTKRVATVQDKAKRIYTTYVGVGLDFNADLIDQISKFRGCNYFSVLSAQDFFKRLDLEFDYIVSPMVFGLRLSLQCEGVNDSVIEAVYGSDDIDIASGEIMRVNTLFPSPPDPDTGDVKGGIVLIKLRKHKNINYDNLMVDCVYENKFGKEFRNSQAVVWKETRKPENDNSDTEYYANLGVRKGILLTRYVLLLKQWMASSPARGTLTVDPTSKKRFQSFVKYFESEIKMCKDETLQKEVQLLTKLINA